LGNRNFYFHRKHHFPDKLSPEFLLVDLVNNINQLAEDPNEILGRVSAKIPTMDGRKMFHAVSEYGSIKTKKFLQPLLK
jgi:hypothetical protein